MDVNIEFAQRMEKILEIFNGNVSELARQAGIAPPSAKRWITGESDPQMSNLVKLARAAGVNVQWLATGEGAQYPTQSPLEIPSISMISCLSHTTTSKPAQVVAHGQTMNHKRPAWHSAAIGWQCS